VQGKSRRVKNCRVIVGWKKGRKERAVESKVVESLSGGRKLKVVESSSRGRKETSRATERKRGARKESSS